MQEDRCSQTCHRWLPLPPENTVLVLLTATEWKARTQVSVLHLLYLPFIKHSASPLAAFSFLPNSKWEPLFQEMSGAQSQGRRMFACCPPPNLVRPSPPRPTPLAADRVPSDHLCYLFCGMGGELMRPGNENIFSP